MTIAKKPTANQLPAKANWEHASQERELAVWQVAALALGINPTSKNVQLARLSEPTSDEYMRIRSFLSRRLRDEPADGYVHYFPEHPYNKGKSATHLKMVDVVSCIDVLNDSGLFRLPPKFVGMRAGLARSPLFVPTKSTAKFVVMAPTSRDSSQTDSQKRDTSKSVSNRIDAQHALLVLALATTAFKYDPKGTKTQQDKVIDEIVKALSKNQFIGNGLGKSAIAKALQLGFATAEDKGIY